MKKMHPIVWAILCLPVVYFAMVAASVYIPGENIFALLERISTMVRRPDLLRWTAYTPRFLLVFLLLYGGGVLLYYADHENRRPGEEYGSAKWGNARELNKRYADQNGKNVILTKHVSIGLDGYRHRRNLNILVVGGSGVHSFDERHPVEMPTALEAGTLNVPGLAGLCAGVEWILAQGVETLCAKESALAALFYKNIRDLPNVKIYGDPEMALHAPIISLNIGDEDSARIADILWEDYSICVRAGAHCAPLMHKALGTVEQGVVRFSFSHFNTEAEVLQTAAAVQELAQEI